MIRISIIIPTYNKRGNIRPLHQAISGVLDDFEVVFINDNSPDGTAEEIKALQDTRIKLVQRKGKLGLGSPPSWRAPVSQKGIIWS